MLKKGYAMSIKYSVIHSLKHAIFVMIVQSVSIHVECKSYNVRARGSEQYVNEGFW